MSTLRRSVVVAKSLRFAGTGVLWFGPFDQGVRLRGLHLHATTVTNPPLVGTPPRIYVQPFQLPSPPTGAADIAGAQRGYPLFDSTQATILGLPLSLGEEIVDAAGAVQSYIGSAFVGLAAVFGDYGLYLGVGLVDSTGFSIDAVVSLDVE